MSWNIIICYCDRRVYCNQITLNLQFYFLFCCCRCSHWKRKIEEKNNDLQHSNWKKRIVIFYCVSIFHPSYQLKSSLCRSEYFLIVFRLAHNFASASFHKLTVSSVAPSSLQWHWKNSRDWLYEMARDLWVASHALGYESHLYLKLQLQWFIECWGGKIRWCRWLSSIWCVIWCTSATGAYQLWVISIS